MSKINLEEDFDFGFTTVSEEEFKQREEKAAEAAASEVTNKVDVMYKMIMPLLQNLSKDADKNEYIYWPDRKKKIAAFIEKLNKIKGDV
jgi:hypothetical protein